MNCNTTHYRANSSSVPGDPTASGTPPTSGIIAAIIGGIIGAMVTGSTLTINGPAAGLIVIVLGAVTELGAGDPLKGFTALLACTVVAGIIQVILGMLKLGRLGLSFPGSVVHGMLSAIGIIIIAKQLHTMLGVSVSGSPLQSIIEIPNSILNLNAPIAAIGLSSLAVMFGLTRSKLQLFRKIPAPLIAALVAVTAGLYIGLDHTHVVHTILGDSSVGPGFLLSVPASMLDAITSPDFSLISSAVFWKHALLICFVASIESILSSCAVERLDPLKRKTNLDRELIGKGLCNMLSGAVGGLPMIAEIVRSSANIANGARSQASNFFHGAFLLLFLATVPGYLHLVPMASLAAILVFVGYQLAKPSHFVHAFEKGKDSGAVFVITVVAILATDLLTGVLVGGALELAMVVWRSRTWSVFKVKASQHVHDDHEVVEVAGPLAFSNYLSLKSLIESQRVRPRLTLDMSRASLVDHTVMEHLSRHRSDFAERGHELDLRFSEHHQQTSAHPFATKFHRPSADAPTKDFTPH